MKPLNMTEIKTLLRLQDNPRLAPLLRAEDVQSEIRSGLWYVHDTLQNQLRELNRLASIVDLKFD